MEFDEKGMFAISKAGHDKGNIYVIWEQKEDVLFLVDGQRKTLARPKKKNRKHVQIVKEIPEELKNLLRQSVTDETIKYILKRYRKEKEAVKEKQG